MSRDRNSDSLPLPLLQMLDRVADRYESACAAAVARGEEGPDLEPFLQGLPELVADHARRHLLPSVPGYTVRGRIAGGEAGQPFRPVVPGYTLLDHIGRGGMGVVYRARQERTGRMMALKAVHGGEFDRLPRLDELRPVFSHPNIVPIEEIIRLPDAAFVVMPYVAGETLESALPLYSTTPDHCPPDEVTRREQRIARLMTQVADAVRHLHERAVMHRDLKPSNILMDGDRPLVSDLGLARTVTRCDDATVAGQQVGTVRYMAPEQLAGDPDLTVAVDVYALGAMLYELLTGHPPFVTPEATAKQLEAARCGADHLPPPREANPQLPADGDLAWIATECLHRDPARRPSAAALVGWLRAFEEGKPVRPRETWAQWRRRILGWFAGEMREPGYVGRWKWAMRAEAVTCPLAHVGVFLLLAASAPGWAVWLCVLGGDALLGWGIWFVTLARKGVRMTPMEQDVNQLWLASTVGEAVIFALHCPLGSPADPLTVVRFYPIWAVMRAVLFYVEGHLFWRPLRLVGGLFLAAAVAMPWLGLHAAVLYAAMIGGWFGWLSFQLPEPRKATI